MKLKITYTIYLLFSILFISGQVRTDKVSIKWGPELKESKKSTLSDLVGYDNSGIYGLKFTRKGLARLEYSLEHFDQSLSKTKSLQLELKYKNSARFYEGIVQLNNELFLFSSYRDQKTKKNSLFVQNVIKNTLQLDPKLKTVSTIDYTGERRRNAGNFNYRISNDSTKLLVFYNLPYNKGMNERFGFHVFDKNMNLIWEKEVTLPYKEELFGIENYIIDNNGNIHLLGIIYKDRKKSKRVGSPNYKYQILSYTKNGKGFKEYPVDIEEKFITDMRIAINKDQDIICAGFYSGLSSYSIKGSFFLKINSKSNRIITRNFKEFGIDFITQNMTERQEKKTKKKADKGKSIELYEYDLRQIILKDDGGAILIGEQFYITVTTTTTTDANGHTSTSTKYHYHYNDIIAINISHNGEIEWAEKIAKSQRSTNDGGFYSSYQLFIKDDNLYFIFNDNPKNLFLKKGDRAYGIDSRSKKSVTAIVELNNKGEQTREALFAEIDSEVIIRPMAGEQISKNELILFGQKKKKQQFAKVTFK